MMLFGKKEIEKIQVYNREINGLKLGKKEINPPKEEPKIPTELTVTPNEAISIKQGQTSELVVATNAKTYNVEVVGNDDVILVTKKYSDQNIIVIVGKNVGNVTVKVSATLSDTKTVEIPVNIEFESETVLVLDQVNVEMSTGNKKTVGADSNAETIDATPENTDIASSEVKKHIKI